MKKTTLCSLLFLFLATLFSLNASAVEKTQISPALSIISNGLSFDKCGLCSNTVCFTDEEFKDALGLKKTGKITISSLPPESDGKLTLNGGEITVGQTIGQSELDSLSFSPLDGTVSETCFMFSCDGLSCKNSVKCSLHLLSSVNEAPQISGLSQEDPALSTHKNIMVYSSVNAFDKDGDTTCIDVSSYAKHGVINIYDIQNGKFTYTPAEDYVGNDSFEVIAKDSYGNTSEPYRINVKVEKTKNNVVYSDMMRNVFHNSAIKAENYGLMSGKLFDGKMCFLPDDCVNRAQFVTYLIKASHQEAIPTFSGTGFADDKDIPVNLKPYIAYAAEKGYISGIKTDSGTYFYPNSNITRAEAGALINNVLGISERTAVSVFLTESNIPSWAEDVISTLNSKGIMIDRYGCDFSASTYLTNSQTAEILCEIYEK